MLITLIKVEMCVFYVPVCVCVFVVGGGEVSAEPDYSQMDFHFSLMKDEASVTVNDAPAANHS